MIKRPTWILLIVLVLVIAAYFVIKNHDSATTTSSTPTVIGNNFLITPADGTLQVLKITDAKGHIFQMQRNSSGAWVITQPTSGTADQSLAGAAETQVGALRIVTSLNNQLNLGDAGLSSPADIIELTFANNLNHVLHIGDLTPTSSGYYVNFDNGGLYVVSQAGIDALLNLLTSPPFPATETANPTLLISPTSTIVTNTPIPTLVNPTSTP